jgi:hypothetical protein
MQLYNDECEAAAVQAVLRLGYVMLYGEIVFKFQAQTQMFFVPKCPDQLFAQPDFYSMDTEGSFPGGEVAVV